MARFEDAILWVRNGGRARRECWASVQDYTRTTPPKQCVRRWHIWLDHSCNSIIQGWGGSVGGDNGDDPVRDGTYYSPTDEDRLAIDWELINSGAR